jgi:3-hydroxybutyrate dehydrogenase
MNIHSLNNDFTRCTTCGRRPVDIGWRREIPYTLSLGAMAVVAKEGASHGVRANTICPGFVRTPLVDKQIPEQAQKLGKSEEAIVREVMLKDTVDGEFTTTQEVAEAALFFAAFESNALTGQSLNVSHGWSMQ